mmetsp:Transcript_14457/g.34858  ORF Transcript_14457/g.34858 Transcript_14457/m.34858 type:complete len:230 (+) Transcript_14457:714-1403(+)
MIRQITKHGMIHGPRPRNHHLRCQVMSIDVLPQIIPSQRAYILFRSQYRASQPRSLECRPMQMIQHQLLVLLIHLLHLPQYHVPLAIDRLRIQPRPQQYIRQYIHRPRHVLLEHLRKIHGLLPRGVRVEMPAHVLDLDLQRVLRPYGRALEGHVLEEVRGAVVVSGLVAGAGVDPHAYRGGVGAENCFGGDAESGWEFGDFGGGSGEEVGGEVRIGCGGGRGKGTMVLL